MPPQEPGPEARERLLDTLSLFVAKGGAAPLLLPPVAPGELAFPDPWAPSKAGVALLLRRLLWHAGLDLEVEVEDRRTGAQPSERKPATRLELVEVRRKLAVFALGFLGEDDMVGAFAHEVGVAHALRNPRDGSEPYRSAEPPVLPVDPEVDPERGSIAAVYLGLGVLAANAAHQQHSVLERQGFNPLIVASVGVQLEAGYQPVASMTYLVAVQAAIRGTTAPPTGLQPTQRRAVADWLDALDGRALRERLGIPGTAAPGTRPPAERFADAQLIADDIPRKTAFRWRTNRKGVGTIAGTVLGLGAAIIVSRGLMPPFVIGGAVGGHLIGRTIDVPRCSACASVVARDAPTCPKCGAILRGNIAHLSDRLEA
ncbi:MAG: zinc ribbon domain-containing protein, partial [Myxococcales bacterium]|nr:zinc ribbon domain-containing protein [Myxococcales bacterium]